MGPDQSFPLICRQNPSFTGPWPVSSQGKSGQAKQYLIPFLWAQVAIWQNGFSFGMHPTPGRGQVPLDIFGQISQAMPQTPIYIGLFSIRSPR